MITVAELAARTTAWINASTVACPHTEHYPTLDNPLGQPVFLGLVFGTYQAIDELLPKEIYALLFELATNPIPFDQPLDLGGRESTSDAALKDFLRQILAALIENDVDAVIKARQQAFAAALGFDSFDHYAEVQESVIDGSKSLAEVEARRFQMARRGNEIFDWEIWNITKYCQREGHTPLTALI